LTDINLSNVANLLYELRGPLQYNFRKKFVLSAELERKMAREQFTGSGIRIPIILNSLQGGGNPGESGTINVPQQFNTTAATVHMQNVVQPVSITMDADEDSMSNSAAEVMTLSIQEARNSLAEIVNDQYNNSGALLATADSTQASAGGLTLKVQAYVAGTSAGTNFDGLYPGRVVDVLTRSTGADPGQGLRRKIASVSESASPPTITFSTTQTASDGGSGNITLSANVGVYIAGVYTSTANNAIQSIQDVASTTLTSFQGIDKTSVTGWQGIDGRNGDTTQKALSIQMLDAGVRRGRRNGGFAWDFGVGYAASIDLYKQGLYAQVRYNPQTATLQSGFSGIVYDGADQPIPLIKEDRFKGNSLILVPTEDLAIYGHGEGPDFVADDGAQLRRFSRSLPRELWLRDKQQLVAKRCNRTVVFNDLDQAA
jgi:hypothetical protein